MTGDAFDQPDRRKKGMTFPKADKSPDEVAYRLAQIERHLMTATLALGDNISWVAKGHMLDARTTLGRLADELGVRAAYMDSQTKLDRVHGTAS